MFEQVKQFSVRFYFRFFESDLLDRAAQVAFYFSFALFPLLYFLISLFGLILDSTDALKAEIFDYLYQLLPPSAFTLVKHTVDETVDGSSTGKLTIGLVITLWSASVGIDSIRSALNSIYQLPETRPWWKTKLLSISLTFILIILVAAVLGFVFYGWQMVQLGLGYFGLTTTSPFVLVSIQWITIILVMMLACEILFNLVPNFERFRWIWITPGSVVAIALWILFTSGFRLYLEHFNNYNRTYGSLGAVIILMLWLYLTAVAVLAGGTINSLLEKGIRHTTSLETDDDPQQTQTENKG